MFKKITKLILLIVFTFVEENILCNFNPMSGDQEEMMKQMQNMTEDEYLSMMAETFKQYKNSPPEERAALAKEFGIPVDQMDQLAEEMLKEVSIAKEMASNKSVKPLDYNEISSTNIPKEQPVTKTYKDKISYTIELLWSVDKILSTFSTKISSNQIFFDTIISKDEKILFNNEITRYYIGVIREHLSKIKNENNVIEDADLEKINKNMQAMIDKLKVLTENLQTIDSEKQSSFNDNLYGKYSIKSSEEKEVLKKKINKFIKETKNSISEIKKDETLSQKTKKKLLNEKDFALLELEKDLEQVNSARFEKDKKKQAENYKKQTEGLNKNIEKIASMLKKIYEEKENPISVSENFITKYFPKDYEIGKKQEEITKRRLEEEIKIAKQRGTASPLETEQMQRRNYSGNDYKNDNYYSGGNDYGDYGGGYGNDNYNDSSDFNKDSKDKSENNMMYGGGDGGEKKGSKQKENTTPLSQNPKEQKENFSNNENKAKKSTDNQDIEEQNSKLNDISKTIELLDALNATTEENYIKTTFDETKDEILNKIKSFEQAHFLIVKTDDKTEAEEKDINDDNKQKNVKTEKPKFLEEEEKKIEKDDELIKKSIKDNDDNIKDSIEYIKNNYKKLNKIKNKPYLVDLHYKIMIYFAENKLAENKLAENKLAENKLAENKLAENKLEENLNITKKSSKNKTDNKTVDDNFLEIKISALIEIIKAFDKKDTDIANEIAFNKKNGVAGKIAVEESDIDFKEADNAITSEITVKKESIPVGIKNNDIANQIPVRKDKSVKIWHTSTYVKMLDSKQKDFSEKQSVNNNEEKEEEEE